MLGRDGDLVDGDQPGVLGLALGDDPLGLVPAGVQDLVPLIQQRGRPAQLVRQLLAQLVEQADQLTPVEHAVRAGHGYRPGTLHQRDDLVDTVERIHRLLSCPWPSARSPAARPDPS